MTETKLLDSVDVDGGVELYLGYGELRYRLWLSDYGQSASEEYSDEEWAEFKASVVV